MRMPQMAWRRVGYGLLGLAMVSREGIWQVTTEIIAKYRYNTPSAGNNEDWATLMEESGLPQFANTTIVAMIEGRLEDWYGRP